MSESSYDRLDDLLTRVRYARQRPSWLSRLFAGQDGVTSLSTLRVLRAVEQCEGTVTSASIGDVADYLAVEPSTASRMVASVVAAGLLDKSIAPHDQRRSVLVLSDAGRVALAKVTARRSEMVAETVSHWPDGDVDALVSLLQRLVDEFEKSNAE